jgi:hypothetical protein
LDSNSYIEAKSRYYQMDFCPAYWDWLDHQFTAGELGSINIVYDELKGFNDELSVWIKERKDQFCDVSDDTTQNQFIEIAEYVSTLENMKPGNIENFLAKADPWLIAKAKVLNAVVVTQETLVDENAKKVKIPNVCIKFGVEYINTFQLLQRLNACFVMQI